MSDDVRMATRDASWYRSPDTRSPKVHHVVVSPPYVAACNAGVMLVDESEASVSAVPLGLRCRRSACLARWDDGTADHG